MIISRVISFVLRFFEVVTAIVSSSITLNYNLRKLTPQIVSTSAGWFLYVRHIHSVGPEGRLTFSLVVGIESLILSLLWLLPFTSTFLHYPLDFINAFGYFTAFGILQDWMHPRGCGQIFQWNGEYHMGSCIDWRVQEAFFFIGGVLWLLSAFLVCLPLRLALRCR
jgi:hypothetical protein